MSELYTAKVKAHGGREGKTETTDGKLSFQLAKPGSSKQGTTNPEELFACGYAACFSGAVDHIGQQHDVKDANAVVEGHVTLNKDDSGVFLGVALHVVLENIEQDKAEKIVREAHNFCPYSKAVKGNIDVDIQVNGKKLT